MTAPDPNFNRRPHQGRRAALFIAKATAILVLAAPFAVVTTFFLMPFWSWLESEFQIESAGHSGPAQWCYMLVYLLMLMSAGLLWRRVRARRPR